MNEQRIAEIRARERAYNAAAIVASGSLATWRDRFALDEAMEDLRGHADQDIPDLLDALEAANKRIAELEGEKVDGECGECGEPLNTTRALGGWHGSEAVPVCFDCYSAARESV